MTPWNVSAVKRTGEPVIFATQSATTGNACAMKHLRKVRTLQFKKMRQNKFDKLQILTDICFEPWLTILKSSVDAVIGSDEKLPSKTTDPGLSSKKGEP